MRNSDFRMNQGRTNLGDVRVNQEEELGLDDVRVNEDNVPR